MNFENPCELMKTDEYRLYGYKTVVCPVCQALTLDSNYICAECLWEYDGAVGEDEFSSVNRATVKEYRERYEHNKSNLRV